MPVELKPFETLYPAESRFTELEKVVSYIKEGNSCQVIGLPGVGRSNMLMLLAYNKHVRAKHFPTKDDYVHFVPVNFSEIRNRGLTDAVKFLFLNLVDSLRYRSNEELHEKVSEIFKDSLSFNDELVLTQGLKRAIDYLAVEQKLTIIFLFDRFEEYIPMLTSEFFANLRIWRNLAKYRFSVVFSLNKPLEDLLEPSLLADYYEFVAGHVVALPMYDKPSVGFRLNYLEQLTGKKLSEAKREEILKLTAGHPKLTRLAAEAVLTEHDEAEETDLQAFLLKQKPVRGALNEIIRALSPVEQKRLFSSVILEGAHSTGSGRPIESQGGDPIVSLQDDVKEYFTEVGLVKDGKIVIPLLTAFIADAGTVQQTEQQPIVFDEEKNVIRKGATTLSDGLTAAEFRLLAYLLHNPDRVLSRDEVIEVVWQDAKSTAGVTDQAVDQLIFRLRRKIEEDPNHPRHLVTVKGRGFSFTP